MGIHDRDHELEQLRRESPAYAGDDGWEEVPPPLGAVLSVRFDIPTMRHIFKIASETNRTASGLIRDWTVERLTMSSPSAVDDGVHAVRESAAEYLVENEDLRRAYRPDNVRWLFVGESSPASGRFFYRANSNLFHAVRRAFEDALGPMPTGTAFLEEFRDRGGWLVDLADQPVNRSRGRPRADAVNSGVARLAATMTETEPELVVAVKATIEGAVRRAAQMATIAPEAIHALPFPVRQWRAQFVRDLAAALQQAGAVRSSSRSASSRLTLEDAIADVLRGLDTAPARAIANEVNRRGRYRRNDGRSVDYQQILAQAHRYPDRFQVNRSGIKLKSL
jgi:hypothetical protein